MLILTAHYIGKLNTIEASAKYHENEVFFLLLLKRVKDKSHVTDVFSGFDPNLHNLPIVDYRVRNK